MMTVQRQVAIHLKPDQPWTKII